VATQVGSDSQSAFDRGAWSESRKAGLSVADPPDERGSHGRGRMAQEASRRRHRRDFFEQARARRVTLPEGEATTTDILREDRDRAGA
jgi:hypothetical protein